jgi:hypothetical protein
MMNRRAIVVSALTLAAPVFAGHTVRPLRVVDTAGVVIGSLASTNGVDGTSRDPGRLDIRPRP